MRRFFRPFWQQPEKNIMKAIADISRFAQASAGRAGFCAVILYES
jgi:hypothetical protein